MFSRIQSPPLITATMTQSYFSSSGKTIVVDERVYYVGRNLFLVTKEQKNPPPKKTYFLKRPFSVFKMASSFGISCVYIKEMFVCGGPKGGRQK